MLTRPWDPSSHARQEPQLFESRLEVGQGVWEKGELGAGSLSTMRPTLWLPSKSRTDRVSTDTTRLVRRLRTTRPGPASECPGDLTGKTTHGTTVAGAAGDRRLSGP